MRSRRSRAAVLDRGRAADTISDLADHAVTLARGAGSAALPTVQRGAEGLSQVLQTAAGTLADTAGNIAGDPRVEAAGNAARERIADASDKLSTAIRPKEEEDAPRAQRPDRGGRHRRRVRADPVAAAQQDPGAALRAGTFGRRRSSRRSRCLTTIRHVEITDLTDCRQDQERPRAGNRRRRHTGGG